MKVYLGFTVKKIALTTKRRDKYLVTRKDLAKLIEHLWRSDDHDYPYKRYGV
jgi:hypothetical protein